MLKMSKKTATESPVNVRSEPLTTRRRALQSWMDGSSSSTVEFPDGLPLAPSRSKKDKLSEEEMLAKKAEAAQRRRMQVEKATKESEAEAIRKILGLDSEKKKEERKQKEREEKERATRAQNIAASSIHWVMGPTGTVVSFPHAVGLPSIFDSKPHSYPPPREKCAGPECTNAYKYRALQAEPCPLQPQVLQGCARKRLTGLWKHHGKERVCFRRCPCTLVFVHLLLS
jgi:hypothetical protein